MLSRVLYVETLIQNIRFIPADLQNVFSMNKNSIVFPWGFPSGLVVKNSPADAEDADSIPGSGRSPGEGNDNAI